MKRKQLLVTGCGGFVAGGIVHEGIRAWELHAISRGAPLLEHGHLVWHTLDLLETAKLESLFRDVKPHAVIHAAAVANIDFCEANKEITYRTNVEVTARLAELCVAHGARMVYVSTDNVFDGKQGNYVEENAPGPLNYYAETKVAAENVVAGMGANWVVARISVVMGLPMLGVGNSFLSRMLPALKEGRELGVPDDEIRSPLDIVTGARALLELAGNEYSGFLHVAGNDILNRYEMVRRIAARLGFSEQLVQARSPVAIPGRAPRPLDASLCNGKARGVLATPMVGLEEGLALVLSSLK